MLFSFLVQSTWASPLTIAPPASIILIRPEDPQLRIRFLEISVLIDPNQPPNTATLEGRYSAEGSVLLNGEGGSAIPCDEMGQFVVSLPLQGDEVAKELIAVDAQGNVQREILKLTLKKSGQTTTLSLRDRLRISPGLSLSAITETEGGMDDYSTIALTAKGSVNYLIEPLKWDAGASFYLTALQLSRSRDVDVHYFGLNLRAGYILPEFSPIWKITIYGGWYYLTTFVNPGSDENGNQYRTFGFRNISGPQIYPTLAYTINQQDALSSYLKFSPVGSSLSLLSLANREVAAGASYSRKLDDVHTGSIGIDFSRLDLNFGAIPASVTTWSLSVSTSI